MRFVWNITIFAGSILLCNQLIHVNNLYRLRKNAHIYQQNEMIKGAIHEVYQSEKIGLLDQFQREK